MKKNITTLRMSLILLMGFFIVFSTNAQSKKLSIQGYLKDGNGKAVDNGNYAITFKIYDVAASGTALWTEDNPAVNVYGGIYTVQLGSITNISTLAWDKPYFLGVSISGTELSPRTELTYAPYAFAVNKATYVQCSGAVGDVKYSILNPTQFATVNGDCWVPMKGQSIAGSQLATLLGINNLTDAGGLFLRGQEFQNGNDNDPNRTSTSAIATLQDQAFLAHNHSATTDGNHAHSINDPGHTHNWNHGQEGDDSGSGGSYNEFTLVPGSVAGAIDASTTGISINSAGSHSHTIGNSGGIETRPKNLNLWTYIRIN